LHTDQFAPSLMYYYFFYIHDDACYYYYSYHYRVDERSFNLCIL
jgi:hypothetical protein